jgi:hypothetical protein
VHPVIMRQLAADRISEIHAKAEDERLTRQARRARRTWRHAPSMRLRLRLGRTLGYDDTRLDAGQRSVPDSGDAITRREALDHVH